MKISGDERKKERREQTESDGGKEMFWVQRIWSYGQLLQKLEKKEELVPVSSNRFEVLKS